MSKRQNGKGDDPRNLGPKFRQNYLEIDWRKLRPSSDWMKLCPDVVIVDFDGWDRSNPANFEKSWGEPITREEFNRRLARSTTELRSAKSPKISK